MSTIGFIGLGNMGGPMAVNLVKAGHTVQVFDLLAESVAKAKAEGAHPAPTAAEAASNADVVISMLPASRHVEAVYLGDDGLLQHIGASTLIIDSSTIAPVTARLVAEAASEKGLMMIDAPVSGGVGGAGKGKATHSQQLGPSGVPVTTDVVDGLDELWEGTRYGSEFDLDTFVSGLKNG